MLFDDHKKAATIIRGRRSAKGERLSEPTAMKPEVVKTEDGEPDGRHAAMQDFLAAHQEASPARMAEAMSNFMHIHNSMQDNAEDPAVE